MQILEVQRIAVCFSYLQNMEANFQENSLRGLATIVQYILQQMYTGIHLSQREVERVKEAAVKAHEQNIPLLLLPTHKSHMYSARPCVV